MAGEGEAAEEVRFRSASEAAGWTQVSNLILLDRNLTDGAKVTYLLLRMYAWQSPTSDPSQSRLSEERACSDRTIRNHLTELEARGLVTIEQRGKKLRNRYWIEPLDRVYTAEDLPKSRRSPRDRKKVSGHLTGNSFPPTDRKSISGPTLEENSGIKNHSGKTLNVGSEANAYKKLWVDPVLEIEQLLHNGDDSNRRRYVQLRQICIERLACDAWEEARRSVSRGMQSIKNPVSNPGGYFDRTLIRLLDQRGISVPTAAEISADGNDASAALAAFLAAEGGPQK